MINEIQGSAFQQTIGSSVDSTVCQIGSNQLTMRSINNGSICQEMLTKQSAKKVNHWEIVVVVLIKF